MPRKANQTIGTLKCPCYGELAAVRKDKGGKLYYVCGCTNNPMCQAQGQRWILENATMWGPDGAPPGTPDWILEGRRSPPKPIETDPGNNAGPAPAHVSDVNPDPGPSSVPRMVTVPSPDAGSEQSPGTDGEKPRALPVHVPGTGDDDDPLSILGFKF